MWILIIMIINLIMNKEKESPKPLTEIKQTKILTQIIMPPYPYPSIFLTHYLILNPPEKQKKQLYKWKAQYNIRHWNWLKSKNVGHFTSIMGFYPRNG